MSLIARHINHLLKSHQCVVIPSFGAFVINYQPAHLKGSVFFPPTSIITFNSDIKHDDGLLVNSVCRAEGIAYNAAYNKVMDDVKAIERQLNTDGEIAFPNIGRIQIVEGHMNFEPFEMNLASIPYVALPKLSIVPVIERTRNASADYETKHDNTLSVKIRHWSQIAASVIVLLCIGILLSTPLQLTESQQASLGQLDVKLQNDDLWMPEVTYHPQELNIAIPAAKTETRLSIAKPATTDSNVIEPTGSCYLIVASLPTRKLAERFIAEADGTSNLRILHADSKYRVYAAVATNIQEALDIKANNEALSNSYPDAWVLKK